MTNATQHTHAVGALARGSRRIALLVAAPLLAVGCDGVPTEPGLAIDTQEQVAAVQEVWQDLPSFLDLEAQVWAAVEAEAITGEGALAILDAGELAAEAGLAMDVGAAEDAERLAEAADSLALEGFLSAHTAHTAEGVLSGVEEARARLEARFGRAGSGELATLLAEADAALHLAAEARTRGDAAGVLHHAGHASDALRWLDPEAKAKSAVARAWVLLDHARRLAGDDPTPEIERALDRAGRLCAAARGAVEAGRWRVAVLEARACARLSRAVIARLAGGVEPDLLAKRAEEAVAHATALLEHAEREAGPLPEPRVRKLLDEAEALRGRAAAALDEARFRAAIGFAIESSARSVRVLRIVRDDGPSPYELRAIVTVEIALGLSARVDAKIDGDTRADLVEATERADALLRGAEEALEAAAYRVAWVQARTAVEIYSRILLALA